MMKKFLIYILIFTIAFVFTACGESESNKEITSEYTINNMLYEKNIDELKKQYPDCELKESNGKNLLIITSMFGDVKGTYYYTIENKQIVSVRFNAGVAYYKDVGNTETSNDNISMPNPNNIDECKSVAKKIYNSLKDKCGCSQMTVKANHKDNGLVALDNITNVDEFIERLNPIFEGMNGEYNNFTFSGFTDTSEFITVTFASSNRNLSIAVILTH